MKREKFLHEQQRFSIRKYSFGAASVLLGASLVFASQALADEHHEVATTSDTILRATSDSDAMTATDIFSGVATDGVASSNKASQVSTTSQTASEAATSEATSEVSASISQAAYKTSESTVASSEAASGTNTSSETVTNFDVSALTRAAVNTSLVSQLDTTTASGLLSQGTYVYKERTEIKNQPKVSAKAEFYVNPGDSVFYDQVVTADGYQWISYKSYSGVRCYAPVEAGSGDGNSGNGNRNPSNDAQATTGALNIPATGTFYFTRDTDIKKEPKEDLKHTFVFGKGDHVIYDKVLTADGHQWLSYVTTSGARRYVDIATVKATETKPEVKPVAKPADKPNLPESGTYTFTGRASIKAEAKVSSPELAYYDKGMTVNYDKVLTADGRQWLSYVTASGARRYVDIAAAKSEAKPETKPVAKPADKPSLPESGTYTFTGRASIKAEAKVSSPELAYYDKGMTVNYDKVLTADGRQWLSYVTTSGARRYVDIAAAKPEASHPAAKPSLPESGRYTFTGRASIKAEAKVSSPELAYYDKGMSVNYDKVLTADGHTWLSYMTVSGARRYVDIA